MSKPEVFISHITEECDLAELFLDHIRESFLGMVEIFVSSHATSISLGSKWLDDIDKALKRARVAIILCSHDSIKRPWVNFEAGACWVKGIPVVPICHTGMRKVDLPIPLNMLQAIEAADEAGLERLRMLLAKTLESEVPTGDLSGLIARVREFEQDYGLVREVSNAVKSLVKLQPDIEPVFRPKAQYKSATGQVRDITLDKMLPYLDALQALDMLAYSTGGNALVFRGDGGGGNVTELNIEVHEPYCAIAAKVLKQ